ncbi:hypothetical protein [Egicoccus sp. AB-alg2]|uniref:hypothetical protein n=1 Tax=Egicoccus sp. AB-alg2 TaxID=3242693 RepID=UPI00359E3FF3
MTQQPSVPPPATPVEEPTAKKPWFKRWWGIALIVVLVLGVVNALSDGGEDAAAPAGAGADAPGTDEADTEAADAGDADTDEAAADAAADDEPADTDVAAEDDSEGDSADEAAGQPEEAADDVEAGTDLAFGNGTYRVGEDLEAGTYRSTGSSLCYWERLAGFSGELDDIIANGNDPLSIVTVDAGDAGFSTQGCGDWLPVEATYPDAPATNFGDGTFVVGEHIAPGSYRADGDADDLCYWERTSGFSGELGDIIANGNSPTVVDISESDAGFKASGCGTWSQ